jgi:acyl dehydratase
VSATHEPAPVRHFESVSVGDALTELTRGPMSEAHLMRWSAAIENWHRIHYDEPFATKHDGLPCLLVNGSWKQHFLIQMLTAWLGSGGWLARIDFSFRRMDFVGDVLTAWGTVTALKTRAGLGFVSCEIGIRNPRGENSTPGTALGILPLRGGHAVPYPYPVASGR